MKSELLQLPVDGTSIPNTGKRWLLSNGGWLDDEWADWTMNRLINDWELVEHYTHCIWISVFFEIICFQNAEYLL
jgi:hypothetical protein